MKYFVLLLFLSLFFTLPAMAKGNKEEPKDSMENKTEQPAQWEGQFQSDTLETTKGPLKIFAVGHGTLLLQFAGKIIHIDPVYAEANYKTLPKADLILITHEHADHLDRTAIKDATKEGTTVILTESCYRQLQEGTVMKNGEVSELLNLKIEAVPAYNITTGRDRFHPKGRDNGYILTMGGKRIYIAGDTEDTPEMLALKNIDVAFLPMNQPYTMTPAQVANAVKAFKPKIIYPYHFDKSQIDALKELLMDTPGTELRIRNF